MHLKILSVKCWPFSSISLYVLSYQGCLCGEVLFWNDQPPFNQSFNWSELTISLMACKGLTLLFLKPDHSGITKSISWLFMHVQAPCIASSSAATVLNLRNKQGAVSIYRCCLTSIGIPMLKIRHGNPHTWERWSLYWNGAQVLVYHREGFQPLVPFLCWECQ